MSLPKDPQLWSTLDACEVDGHMAHICRPEQYIEMLYVCLGTMWTSLVCDVDSQALPIHSLPGDCPFWKDLVTHDQVFSSLRPDRRWTWGRLLPTSSMDFLDGRSDQDRHGLFGSRFCGCIAR